MQPIITSYLTEHILPSIIGRRERVHDGVDVQFISKRLVNVENVAWFNLLRQHFYRAMLCIRGTSHGPVSVSVCHKSEFY